MPDALLVQFPYFLEFSDGLEVSNSSQEDQNATILSVSVKRLLVGEMLNLTYRTLFNPNRTTEENLTQSSVVRYTTIQQEGIGLEVNSS